MLKPFQGDSAWLTDKWALRSAINTGTPYKNLTWEKVLSSLTWLYTFITSTSHLIASRHTDYMPISNSSIFDPTTAERQRREGEVRSIKHRAKDTTGTFQFKKKKNLLWTYRAFLIWLVGLILWLVTEEVAGQDGGGVSDFQNGGDARSAASSSILCWEGKFAGFLRRIGMLQVNGYGAWKSCWVILSQL